MSSNHLYYMKVFFLQHRYHVMLGLLVFALGFASAVMVFKPKIPKTEQDYTEFLKNGEHLFEAKRYEEAYEVLIYPAEYGYPRARYLLGEMYYNGFGVERDLKKAAENFKKAAESMTEAKYMVALMSFRGEAKGMPKGQATAFLTDAAYRGYKRAQADLGVYSYLSGDYEQAYFWLSLAQDGAPPRIRDALYASAEKLSDYQRGLLDAEVKGFFARK